MFIGTPSMAEINELLDQLRKAVRANHFTLLTEKAYVRWTERFLVYHGNKLPAEMTADDIRIFLKHLVVDCKVSNATQKQALNALICFYQHVFHKDLRSDFRALCKTLTMSKSLHR